MWDMRKPGGKGDDQNSRQEGNHGVRVLSKACADDVGS